MPNPYFKFKQFMINQDQCAMKVCTDSCLFGAYVDAEDATKVLDIGTGTGLLPLMLAQRSSAQIDTVEIDRKAFQQATVNIQKSKWHTRIRLYHQSIQEFAGTTSKKYELIISNPPFFQNSLKPSKKTTNIALHTEELSLEDLLNCVDALLEHQGRFAVLLPEYEAGILENKAKKTGLHVHEKLWVYNQVNKPVFRVIQIFYKGKEGSLLQENKLVIRDQQGNYSLDFKNLLREYYLIF